MPKLERLAIVERFDFPEPKIDSTWGVQSEWASKLTLLWKNIGSDTYRIKYTPSKDVYEEVGWWFAAIHLLSFGMGWADIGKGLKVWREGGYRLEHPILKTLFDTFGPSLEALELWFEVGNGSQIDYYLARQQRDVSGRLIPAEPKNYISAENFRSRSDAFKAKASGPRTEAAAKHFLDMGDALHLTGHFPALIEASAVGVNNIRITDGLAPLFAVVKLPSATGLFEFFNRNHSALFEGIQMGDVAKVLIIVEPASLTLSMQYSLATGRWYWNYPYLANWSLERYHEFGKTTLLEA